MRHVDEVRRFNRFYTGRIGILPEDYLGSSYSLAEARLLYELGQRRQSSAGELGRELELDPGYLSRLLQGLRRRGLVHARRAADDARRSVLTLTPKGQKSYQLLDSRSRKEVGELLGALPAAQRARLVAAMKTVESALKNDPAEVALRAARPGDYGWVVHAHGKLYFEEFGWDERFEAMVAGIVQDFVERFDPVRERSWIAELDGEPVGSVFLKKESKTTAKLRLLILDPRARGLGVGRRLVAECIAFARAKGYRRLVLWTQSNLAAARHLYQAAGFRITRREKHREFGYDLTGEFWELDLQPPRKAST